MLDRDQLTIEKHLALEAFRTQSAVCSHKWLLFHKDIELAACELLEPAKRVVQEQRYEPCLRAGFFAALFNPHTHKFVTRIEGTRPPCGAMLCQASRSCLRIDSGVYGDYYGNCPSVHATQWLDVPQGFDSGSLLWMEAGAVLLDHGTEYERYVLAQNDEAPYRCSMCLKTMAGKGIVDVCRVSEVDGKVQLHFAPITSSLDCLVACNVADLQIPQNGC